ncbi:MAG: O-antigen ligase family protein [Bacteroidaceae bacterium]|nr:O-antigen ligase family protein [Bacteroidaceae bacterium]
MLRLLFLLTVFGSLVTQIPGFIERGWDMPLKMLWIVTFACMLYRDTLSVVDRRIRFLYLLLVPFVFYCAFMDASTIHKYFNVDVTNMLISVMVCLTSYVFFKNYGDERLMGQLSRLLLAGALMLGAIVYMIFFRGQDLVGRTYAFEAKNSMGQILLCCAIVGGIFYRPNSASMRWAKYAAILALVYIIMIMRSRATILGLFYVIAYLVFRAPYRRLRYIVAALCAAVGVYVLMSSAAYEVLVDGILLGGRDIDYGLDEASSGRVTNVREGLDIIAENLWVGVGDRYLDCMPVAMMMQFGLVGASMVFLYIGVVWRCVERLDTKQDIHLCTYLLFYSMMLNSLFEAKPPFGPGIKCFLMWLMIGFSLALTEREALDEEIVNDESLSDI